MCGRFCCKSAVSFLHYNSYNIKVYKKNLFDLIFIILIVKSICARQIIALAGLDADSSYNNRVRRI